MRELGADGEAGWQALRQHAAWAQGVWFAWVLVPDAAAVTELVERLDALPSTRRPSLVLPLESVETTLELLFSTEAQDRRAVWVVAGPEARAAWESFHLVLNERRERLRRHLDGPVIFAGEPSWKQVTRVAAPDLWSQRTAVLEWEPEHAPTDLAQDHGPELAGPPPESHDRAVVEQGLARARARGDKEAEAVALTRLAGVHQAEGAPGKAHEEAARAVELAPAGPTRARALAAMATAEVALRDFSTAAGHFDAGLAEPGVAGDEAAWWAIFGGRALRIADQPSPAEASFERAVTLATEERTRMVALLELGRIRSAQRRIGKADAALAEALTIARARRARHPRVPEALDDLGSALVAHSDALRGAGDAKAAGETLAEAIPIARTLLSLVRGPSRRKAETLLALTLGPQGDAALARGDFTAARKCYTESVGLCRGLASGAGATSDTLRLLTIALQRVGDVERASGDLAAALAAYSESVAVAQRRRARWGDHPDALRELAASLKRVGDTEHMRGNVAGARSAYLESLSLRRKVHARRSDAPEALHDLSVALRRLGEIEREAGHLEAAHAASAESVALAGRLRATRGETPEVLRHLSTVLRTMGGIERDRGRVDAARTAFLESLGLRRALRVANGATPDTLREISTVLDSLAELEESSGDLPAARAAFAEALDLRREILARWGDTLLARSDLALALQHHGDIERASGDLTAARGAYTESLAVARDLRLRRGELPQTLGVLAGALARLAELDARGGYLDAAREGYAEALDLMRAVRARQGEQPAALANVVRALGRLHSVAPSPPHVAEARELIATLRARWPRHGWDPLSRWLEKIAGSSGPGVQSPAGPDGGNPDMGRPPAAKRQG